jgi:hypothetical protein
MNSWGAWNLLGNPEILFFIAWQARMVDPRGDMQDGGASISTMSTVKGLPAPVRLLTESTRGHALKLCPSVANEHPQNASLTFPGSSLLVDTVDHRFCSSAVSDLISRPSHQISFI